MKWPFWTRTRPGQSDDCETIDPLLSLYADGMASGEEARRVEAHLIDCADCRESLQWLQATQRALSTRPVVIPPVDLHARIAAAIAASSASPLPASFQTRPARAFALRPALAAAASLSILGLVGYGLLHHPSHTVASVVKPPQVAVLPSVNSSLPNVLPTVPKSQGKPHMTRHLTVTPKPVHSNPDLVATNPSDEPQPEPASEKSPTAPLLALIKPHVLAVKKPILPKAHSQMMAIVKPATLGETHHPTVITPEPEKTNVAVAATPKPDSTVAVTVAPTIVHQDPAPTQVASTNGEGHPHNSDLLGAVNAYVGKMRTAAYSTERKSIKGAAYATTAFDLDKSGTQQIVGTDLH